jgi:hypothetical protein
LEEDELREVVESLSNLVEDFRGITVGDSDSDSGSDSEREY